jgi:hypothetical protein
MPNLEDQVPTLEVINKEITDALSRQTASLTQIDTKAALLAGVAATAAQFLAGRTTTVPEAIFAMWAFISYGVAFVCALAAYAVARTRDVPSPRGLVGECIHLSKAETLARLVATRVEVHEANRGRSLYKAVLWWASVLALTLGLGLSTLALSYGTPAVVHPPAAEQTPGP